MWKARYGGRVEVKRNKKTSGERKKERTNHQTTKQALAQADMRKKYVKYLQIGNNKK